MMDHGALVDAFLAHLSVTVALGFTVGSEPLVGDGVAPVDGGWVNGQPDSGVFRPYSVLVDAGSSPRAADLALSFPGAWTCGWSVRSFGGSRKQCDWMATRARAAVDGMGRTVFGEDPWTVIGTEWSSLGSVVRIDSTNPPFWQVYDTLSLIVSP